MKRLISFMMMVMLAFSIFASTTTVLNIEATVAEIQPTYSLEGKLTYGKNTGKEDTTKSTTTQSVSIDEGSTTTVKLEAPNARFTSGTETTINNVTTDRDDDTFVVEVSLIQSEARYYGNVKVEFQFSEITYDVTANNKGTPNGTYSTGFPTKVEQSYSRTGTIALNVGGISTLANGYCYLNLEYTLFGYFIKNGTKITTLKATYDIPTWTDDDTDSSGYFPFGTYSGTVTVTISDRS